MIPLIAPATPSIAIRSRASIASDLPPKPGETRYRSLDAWRGLACMMLVFYHASFYAESTLVLRDPTTWSLSGWAHKILTLLWVGVPIFFVISGYCIAASIDSLRRKPHSLGNYLYRRVRRIYPPLWAGLLIAVLFTSLALTVPTLDEHCLQLPRFDEFQWTNWVGNATMSESWLPHLVGTQSHYLLNNTWTLCYEEQFYLVTAVLLAFMARRFFLATVILSTLVLLGRHWMRANGIELHGFFFDGLWLLFASGILVYHRLHYASSGQVWAYRLLMLAGMLYAFLDRRDSILEWERHFDEYLFIACGFSLLVGALKRWDVALVRHPLAQPFLWCGQRSYSIYLTHYPIVVAITCYAHNHGLTTTNAWLVLTLPICLLAALPLANLFYHGIEKHFQNTPAEKGR